MLSALSRPPAPPSFLRATFTPTGQLVGELDLGIAMWGSPLQRDSYNTFFDKNRPPDMALDFLPFPLMYEHGQAGSIQREIIGALTSIYFDDEGIKGRAFLNTASPFFTKLVDDIRRKKLFTSSATAGHIADFDDEGRFVKWYLTELSLTENPAESRMPYVKLLRSASVPGGQCIITPENYPLEPLKAGVNTGLTPNENVLRSQSSIMSALESLLQSGQELTLEAVLSALGQDGYTPEQIMGYLQQMAAPSDGGQTPPPAMAEQPVPTTPAITPPQPDAGQLVPGGVSFTPEDIAQYFANMNAGGAGALPQQGRSRTPGGMSLGRQPAQAPAQRNAESAAPIPGQRRAAAFNPVPQRGRQPQVSTWRMGDRFQHLTPDAMALGYMMLEGGVPKNQRNRSDSQPVASEEYVKAMAYKTAVEIQRNNPIAVDYAVRSKFPFHTPNEVFESDVSNSIRANEIMTGANGQGGEWIYDLQGTQLWETIRSETPIYQAMRSKGMDEAEIPQGYDSELIPLEGSDPSWYVAGGASSVDAGGYPTSTFSTSKFGTGQKAVTVAKLSVAMDFRKELEEDSIINIVQEASRKIRVTAAEQIDYILINGDTDLTINTNINLIDSTPAAAPAQPSYTLLDGLLKLPLVTNTANKRDCGATFDETDFLETYKLLPVAYRQNRDKLLFILDSDTGIAASNIPTVKTRDVYSKATLEEGVLVSIWRIDVMESGFMYLANTAGKISNTAGNNTFGRLLLVRPDQWAARWKRRIQTEVTYYPRADVTEVVAHMRWGLAYRDNEASAVTYDVPTTL